MKIDGTCHCGNITYQAEIDPDQVYICHCTDCQTISGSAFRWAVSEACAAALKQGAPVHEAGGFEIDTGATVRYRSVFTPLRSASRTDPDYLFGAYGSRIFGATAPAAAPRPRGSRTAPPGSGPSPADRGRPIALTSP